MPDKQAETFLQSRQCSKPNCSNAGLLEVRKNNGEEYSPDTLHHLCMCFLRSNGWPSIDQFTNTRTGCTLPCEVVVSIVHWDFFLKRTGHKVWMVWGHRNAHQMNAISRYCPQRSRVESPPNMLTISTPTMPGLLAVPSQATQAPITQFALTFSNASIPGHFHFNSCSSITI